ncbi:MAG: Dipeptidyl aminopeptidase/acylaminoacyl-peptidase-like protein [Verrucomicrobiaceae bacterium]|nr:Dipeptidyl aminopeptidase/acylaminoacyl-peptidase-like protein [Verrucomicrobiaceae bacterium]
MPHPLHNPPASSAVLADQLWFSCSSCKGELKVPVALADTKGACPLCGEEIHIPAHSEKRKSVAWQGQKPEATGGETLLPVDDPELDGDTRKCFRGDLHFRSGATQPLSSARGFFDDEEDLLAKGPIARKESVAVKIPEPPKSSLLDGTEAKSGIQSFSKPLRKFVEPIATSLPVTDAVVTKVLPLATKILLPVIAPAAEETKEETSLLVVSSLEKDSSLFKPLRKYPPKERHRAKQKSEVAPPPLPQVVVGREQVPVEQSPPPFTAPSQTRAVAAHIEPPPAGVSEVAPPLPTVVEIPEQVPVMQSQPPSAPAHFTPPSPAPPVAAYVEPQPSETAHIEPESPVIAQAVPEPLVAAHVAPEPAVLGYLAPPPPVVETPVLPMPEAIQVEPSLPVVGEQYDPLPLVLEAPEAPAPKRVTVLKALERSVAMRRGSDSRSVTNRLKYAVAPLVVQPAATQPLLLPVSQPHPTIEPEPVIVPKSCLPAHTPAIHQANSEVETIPSWEVLPPKRLAIADLLEPEPVEHYVSPAVIGGEPDETEEAQQPVRIGGVVMPRYTLVPRGSQLWLWMQRVAIGMLCLLPMVAFSGLYMPYVRRVAAWVEVVKRSRISLEEIRQQTAANRSSPSAQGFKDDALAAMKQEWTKLTTPQKKTEGKNAITRPVVFRSSKTDFVSANPETNWPQILLRNHGVFHGHSAMEGGSSFLIEASDGSHWIATSAHLLGEAGGVEPPVQPGKLVTDLDRWRAHLPDKNDTFAEVLGGRQLMTVITSDWLAMRLSSNDAVLPVKPLRLRRTLLQPDETVYLVGLPYNDKSGASQHVYRGQVTTASPVNPSQFAVLVEAGVDFSGFRGAPILDAEGEVVGVLTDRWSTILLATRSELLAQLIEGK